MDKRTRAYKIFQAGRATYGEEHTAFSMADRDLLAIAAMIDFATAKKKPAKDKDPLLFTEQDVLKAINYDLQVTRWGGLNAQLRRMSLKGDDLEKFKVWFDGSMYPWMKSKDIELTFSMLTRKFPEWLERARHYAGSGFDTSTPEESSWR